ncbi:MAG: dihydroorotase [Cyanobacteria bacterium SW_6_48_11]|nr:MAG: dihydroorotase [Cyanobacteria bacterium QS_4_48_99]PSO85659.1 MAG: dihydroorotase [Cyanobacteria bacterium QS_3_48_167]PSO94085.1 MAG: dihydroorotase [Cyanobacteria bacterium SW_6_48_11]PSP25170.1 MAG: dihydroorotase [Cyanobacteria bacterium SW_8_48_13]
MTMELLQRVRVLDPVSETDEISDVLIAEGEIKAIGSPLRDIPQEAAALDCQGLVLAPGLVDLYSHNSEPGNEDRETLSTLVAAAAAGGFTRLGILPDTVPPVDNPGSLAWLQQRSRGAGEAEGKTDQSFSFAPGHLGTSSLLTPHSSLPHPPHLHFWGALTLGVKGEQMTELAELATAGVIGFADGHPVENLGLLRRLLEYLAPLEKPVALVAAESDLRGNGVMREGVRSLRSGLPGDPTMSESAALAALLEVVAATRTPVHLMRISTARGVELIADAKARGLPVTASTTWMHLLLNAEAVGSYDPNLRLEPPLGDRADQLALSEGVKHGVIDTITVDHTPYTYEEKTVAFADAPPGAIGLELALPLLWQTFVETGEWSALQLWRALSIAPQKCLQQKPTSCAVGKTAELVLFDPQKNWIVQRNTLHSASANTPWFGKELTGKVVKIWMG